MPHTTNESRQVQCSEPPRERVLADPTELRRLLHGLLVAARAIIEGETESEIQIREAISALALAFDQHFWMREKHLLRTTVDDSVQASVTLDEHRQQREIVFALLSEATAGDKAGAALADDACWLVESLLRDLHREDQLRRLPM